MTEDNWQSVHEIARRLRERAVAAMNAGNNEVAEAYHAKALSMEISEWLKEK